MTSIVDLKVARQTGACCGMDHSAQIFFFSSSSVKIPNSLVLPVGQSPLSWPWMLRSCPSCFLSPESHCALNHSAPHSQLSSVRSCPGAFSTDKSVLHQFPSLRGCNSLSSEHPGQSPQDDPIIEIINKDEMRNT